MRRTLLALVIGLVLAGAPYSPAHAEPGDGVIDGAEQCDDANEVNGDGCSATGQIEAGWQCAGEPSVCSPVLGDGIVTPAEACDDGNEVNGDGCDANGQVESGFHCSGQPSVCQTAGVVGDGVIGPGEQCDDSDTDPGDGCGSTGQIEPGWQCTGEPSVCTPLEPVELALLPTTSTITVGQARTLQATSDVSGPVVLEQQPAGSSTWATVGNVTITGGTGTVVVRPTRQTSYRLSHPGDAGHQAGLSGTVTVLVRAAVTARVVDRTVTKGRNLVVKGSINPRKRGVPVSLWRKTSTGKLLLARATTRADGTYTITKRMTRVGKQKVFTTIPARSGNLAAQSPLRGVAVR